MSEELKKKKKQKQKKKRGPKPKKLELYKGVYHERWKDYKLGEIIFVKRKLCSSCIYHKKVTGFTGGATSYCDYLSMEGHRRGCRPEMCDKYIKIEKKKKEVTNETDS